MSEPTMYPSADTPTFRQEFETFTDLRVAVEGLDEGLNTIVSWHVFTPPVIEDFPAYEPHDHPECVVLIYMPRPNETIEVRTERFDPIEVEAWLEEYVRPGVMRWYGWAAK